jgi:hypothetical protein
LYFNILEYGSTIIDETHLGTLWELEGKLPDYLLPGQFNILLKVIDDQMQGAGSVATPEFGNTIDYWTQTIGTPVEINTNYPDRDNLKVDVERVRNKKKEIIKKQKANTKN